MTQRTRRNQNSFMKYEKTEYMRHSIHNMSTYFHLPKSPLCLLRFTFKLRASFSHSAVWVEGKGLEVEDFKVPCNPEHFMVLCVRENIPTSRCCEPLYGCWLFHWVLWKMNVKLGITNKFSVKTKNSVFCSRFNLSVSTLSLLSLKKDSKKSDTNLNI